MSGLASKKLRLEAGLARAPNKWLKLAERARKLRIDIVKSLSQLFDIASLFSDPAFNIKLVFPSVFSSLPKRN
jgi:hypothetical protein